KAKRLAELDRQFARTVRGLVVAHHHVHAAEQHSERREIRVRLVRGDGRIRALHPLERRRAVSSYELDMSEEAGYAGRRVRVAFGLLQRERSPEQTLDRLELDILLRDRTGTLEQSCLLDRLQRELGSPLDVMPRLGQRAQRGCAVAGLCELFVRRAPD